MRPTPDRRWLMAAMLMLAGCSNEQPEASGLTPSEVAQLNEAAADLDNQAAALDALQPTSPPEP